MDLKAEMDLFHKRLVVRQRENSLQLLFVYIDDFGPLKKVQLSLDAKVRCNFDGSILSVESGDELPQDFWNADFAHPDARLDASINCVSAVIGGNGTGKTAVARYLAQLCSDPQELKRYLVVYRYGESYFCSHKGYKFSLVGNVGVTKNPVVSTRQIFHKDLRILYITPHFVLRSIYEGIDDAYAVNLSTAGLLNECASDALDRSLDDTLGGHYSAGNASAVLRFEREEQTRMFRLMADIYGRCAAEELSLMDIPQLKGIKIELAVANRNDPFEYVRKAMSQKGMDSGLREYRHNQNVVADAAIRISDFFVRTFLYYAANSWQQYDVLGDVMIDDKTYGELLASFLVEELSANVQRDNRKRTDYRLFSRNILAFLAKYAPRYDEDYERVSPDESKGKSPDYEFFKLLDELIANNAKINNLGSSVEIRVKSLRDKNSIDELIRLYHELARVSGFLDMSFLPCLSAGQEAFFTMWSRIYDWSWNPMRLKTPKEFQENDPELRDPDEMSMAEFVVSQEPYDDMDNVIIYFDEAETSLHPEWQRKLVYETIWFLRRLIDDMNIHVIFASHSPILLTDIR